jgi:anti-sigma B factor antagonist
VSRVASSAVDGEAEVAVVSLQGDIDLAVVAPVRAGLREVFVEGSAATVHVDLTRVRFIDSSGIGVLVWAHKQARVFQVDYALVGPSTEVAQVLRVLGLDRILTILPAVEPTA